MENFKKERIVSIDILKVIAVFMVLNSHMEICYGEYSVLATGGAIGDALFFFSSGFTILLGKSRSFPNYYKRRIARIYPTILAVVLMSAFLFGKEPKVVDNLLFGGGWFVQCIMIYYIPLYFIHRYFLKCFIFLWFLSAIIIVISYYAVFQGDWNDSIFMYSGTKFKWVFNFLFMLYGGYVGLNHNKIIYHWRCVPLLIVCVIIWYSFFFLSRKSQLFVNYQYISILPLLGVVHYLYMLCNCPTISKMAKGKIVGQIIFIIGGLCLESYLIQFYLFTDKLNWLFPINIPIIMMLVLVIAYVVNFLANLISQTFKAEDYSVKNLFLHKTNY